MLGYVNDFTFLTLSLKGSQGPPGPPGKVVGVKTLFSVHHTIYIIGLVLSQTTEYCLSQ